jgi:predicted lipid-binding transport protein (Tim44 family)
MQDGLLDIILIACVAGFILLRLRSVLGKRTGLEKRPEQRPADNGDNVVPLPKRTPAEAPHITGSTTAAVLARIKMADHSFDEAEFVEGAKAAYEMIVTAFAQGDMDTLKSMLAPDVYTGFAQAIDERTKAGHKLETIVNTIKSATLAEAELKGSVAEVTVKFVSELVNVTRNADDQVVGGSPGAVEDVTDVWTFSRDTRSKDPNWTLIGTQAPA